MPQWYANVPALLKVKVNCWPCCSWLLVKMAPFENNGVASLTITCGAESWFVHMTIVPTGTETDAGTKAKFWMAMATGEGGSGVVGAGVVVTTGGVVAVVMGAVVTGARVVAAGVAGAVVGNVVAGVVAGAGPDGDVQPAARTAARMAIPRIPETVRANLVLMKYLTG
jgi:hypothetical protein